MSAVHGDCLLCSLVNTVLGDAYSVSSNMFEGLAVLVPKVRTVLEPKHTRPIVLGEASEKLVTKIAVARLMRTASMPLCMLGGRRGGQVADEVFVARRMMSLSAMCEYGYVYVKLDISAAYDSVGHGPVLSHLDSLYRPDVHDSLRYMHALFVGTTLGFSVLGCQWTCRMQRGRHKKELTRLPFSAIWCLGWRH